VIQRLTDLFPLWAILLSVVAYAVPAPFAALRWAITPLLGAVMLGMGLTLTAESFRLVLRRPKVVLTGAALQFALMPAIAWAVARGLGLPDELTRGLVLVGACPGGTASNVVTYLARGDLALSITLTSTSTLLAVLLTPALTWVYLDTTVDVPAAKMLVSVLELVLAPVAIGATLSTYLGARLESVRRVFPLVSMAAIVLIIAIIIGLTRDRIAQAGLWVLAAVVLHNALGLASGYGAARALGFSVAERRTLAIEVGMQNSGLGVALAAKYFSAMAALPGAIFSIWHNLSGSALAARWARSGTDLPAPAPTSRGR
jgi:BASS family bile acid:Na+ symporter